MAKRRRFSKLESKQPKHRINENIRIPTIRLVGDNMKELSEGSNETISIGVYPTSKALRWARENDLDLVEISPKADPPVCKIIDYKKFIYNQKRKEKEMKSKAAKTVIKEIRFGPNTDDHDFQFKLKHAKNFLEDGAKVKAYVHFRGRTIVFKDRGELLLLRFIKDLEEYGSAESLPKMEGRRMLVMIGSKKKKSKK